jgi:hypothetical protein
MNKQTKITSKKQVAVQMDLDDMGIEEIMESDLEDYEIAAELGMSLVQVSRIRRELFEE